MTNQQNTMKVFERQFDTELVEVSTACFVGSSGTGEYSFMLKPTIHGDVDDQLDWLDAAMQDVLGRNGLGRECIVFRRFFCSDLPNQIDKLRRHPFSNPEGVVNGAVSLVIQPPAAPAEVSLWVYCIKDQNQQTKGAKEGASFSLKRGGLEHVWSTGLACPEKSGSHAQTLAIFDAYNALLTNKAMTLQDHCLRTWFYVKDVDSNYDGLVKGRNQVFKKYNLTPKTHYIASTGIQGSYADINALVMMDAYAIKGIQPGQVRHLQALDHLSHTHVYGVAFERATSIAYRDRQHIIISGTASIDANGEVVHEGEVMGQLERTLENIAALLDQANATIDDMQHFIVYLRNSRDTGLVRDHMKERFGNKPFLVVTGPVCRPSWLVEIEGIAVVPNADDTLPAF
jgi:enamine deaminase RidA (YjgF/YER057c/UK114 family)